MSQKIMKLKHEIAIVLMYTLALWMAIFICFWSPTRIEFGIVIMSHSYVLMCVLFLMENQKPKKDLERL